MQDKNRCGNCEFYTGLGDWGLSCTNPAPEVVGWCGVLVYEESEACKNFKEKLSMEVPNENS